MIVKTDPDAAQFIERAAITDAGQKYGIDQFVKALKVANNWSGWLGVYPLVGGSSSTHAKNLRYTDRFDLTFTGGVTHHATNGIILDGSTGYVDTGINVATELMTAAHYATNSRFQFCVACYRRNTLPDAGTKLDGHGDTSAWILLEPRQSGGGTFRGYYSDQASSASAGAVYYSAGFHMMTRQTVAAPVNELRSETSSTTALANQPATLSSMTGTYYMGRSHGNASSYHASEYGFYAIGYGNELTTGSTLRNAVDNFMRHLSRHV